ncbi:H-NS family nucleoid-associated regulatory protein [Mesorhizobium sp. BR-1-1-10]|uniref:H-NS histone family protein n=1 Tax=Mesorhizobium sp. BR-1-1-10 TaxID=2876660 RepID=UPI001CD15182|nr:H-NS family nucleoid-associated regulatory protein [Mesorhizobium sp. BR-1-1-10]MBZ9975518.1 H-NS histone family protein [Mesorhizobium sp. BR-1-1-10]
MAKLPFFKNSNLPDLTSLSLDELTQLHTHVGKHLVDRKEARIKELQAELQSLGATPDGPILVGRGKTARTPRVGNGKKTEGETALSAGGIVGNGKTRAKPAVKYKDDKGNSWTGRGATPKWLAAYEAEGKKRDDFLV